MDARELYRAGKLTEAIAAMNEEVRKNPTDTSRRGFLCELLCAAGNFDRADKLLDAINTQEPQAGPTIAVFRHLLRAEQARRQLWTEGRLPEFLGAPTAAEKLLLEAVVATREGRHQDAAKLASQADEARPKPKGKSNKGAFEDLRDLDDLSSASFEVLTSNGKYYWIPVERVELVEFRAAARPRDLIWRRAHMIVKDGPDGEVFVPAVYAGLDDIDDAARLARTTDWRGGEGSPVRGVGQRTFLVGEEPVPILEIEKIEFETPGS